jgi:uncharacterized protein YkwD
VRPPRILLLLCCAALAGAVVPGARSADDPYAALLAPSGQCGGAADQLNLDQSTAQQAMTCLTNYARMQSGLVPLQPNSALNDAGQAKLAADLSCAEFSHTPCGSPFTAVFETYIRGATSYGVGENIAWGTGSFGTPRQTMNGWLHSTGHRENILRADYRELGIGYLADQTFQGYAGATLWSQEFGVRTPGSPPTSGPTSSPPPANAQPVSAPAATKPVLKKQPTRHRKTRRHLHLHR